MQGRLLPDTVEGRLVRHTMKRKREAELMLILWCVLMEPNDTGSLPGEVSEAIGEFCRIFDEINASLLPAVEWTST